MRISPRIAIVVAAVLVVAAAGAIIAFVVAGSGGPSSGSSASPSFIGGKENGPPTATAHRPSLNPTAPLVTAAPKPGTASGRLVAGFPSAAAPPEGASVTTSSIAVDGGRVQAALTATVAASPQDVQAGYASRLTALGMTSAPVTAQPGTTVTTFSRSQDAITITTSASPEGTSLTVFGLFTVPKG